MTRPRTVVIVGGGISGLATAFALLERASTAGISLRCAILDAGSSWGGKIVTHRVGDIVTEAGPDSFLSQKPAALDLCTKLGLADQLINTNETVKKACVLYKGRMHDLPEGLLSFVPRQLKPFLRSGLLTWTGLVRMGLEIAVPLVLRQAMSHSPVFFVDGSAHRRMSGSWSRSWPEFTRGMPSR